VNRWKVVADHIGTKDQKAVIAKAKQIAERHLGGEQAKKREEQEAK